MSFGVADSTQGESVEELLCAVGDALAAAKRNGRNRVVSAQLG